jgi:hypothetical protein
MISRDDPVRPLDIPEGAGVRVVQDLIVAFVLLEIWTQVLLGDSGNRRRTLRTHRRAEERIQRIEMEAAHHRNVLAP